MCIGQMRAVLDAPKMHFLCLLIKVEAGWAAGGGDKDVIGRCTF